MEGRPCQPCQMCCVCYNNNNTIACTTVKTQLRTVAKKNMETVHETSPSSSLPPSPSSADTKHGTVMVRSIRVSLFLRSIEVKTPNSVAEVKCNGKHRKRSNYSGTSRTTQWRKRRKAADSCLTSVDNEVLWIDMYDSGTEPDECDTNFAEVIEMCPHSSIAGSLCRCCAHFNCLLLICLEGSS